MHNSLNRIYLTDKEQLNKQVLIPTMLLLFTFCVARADDLKADKIYKVIGGITIYENAKGRIYYWLTARTFNWKYKVYLKKDKQKEKKK